MADYKHGYSSTGAPLAVKDKIISGMAGGEFGVRGFIDAYDAKTGKRIWRFKTIPEKGEPGNETWDGDSWKTGSATTWVTGVYDPETNTIYWGTGNPGPDWNGDARKGDNLYSDSLIALDADTGVKKWHFQYTPHDVNDWDSTQTPILADTMVQGQPRKIVVLANRNGFYYALDRISGKFVAGRPFVKQTWATGLDESGRPMRLPNTIPTPEGNLLWPSLGGGSNWYSSTYSPKTDLYYVNAKEQAAIYHKGAAEYKAGAFFNGGGQRDYKDEDPYGAVRALEVATGKLVWEFKLHSPPHAGLMSTAGGLVFGSSRSAFFALDAKKGDLLVAIRDRRKYRRQSDQLYERRQAICSDPVGTRAAGVHAGLSGAGWHPAAGCQPACSNSADAIGAQDPILPHKFSQASDAWVILRIDEPKGIPEERLASSSRCHGADQWGWKAQSRLRRARHHAGAGNGAARRIRQGVSSQLSRLLQSARRGFRRRHKRAWRW
jgi:outer membrane protein assembly factor BamB